MKQILKNWQIGKNLDKKLIDLSNCDDLNMEKIDKFFGEN